MNKPNIQIGHKVMFVYTGEPPFSGDVMTGEIISRTANGYWVHRDKPWRHADAIATHVDEEDVSLRLSQE